MNCRFGFSTKLTKNLHFFNIHFEERVTDFIVLNDMINEMENLLNDLKIKFDTITLRGLRVIVDHYQIKDADIERIQREFRQRIQTYLERRYVTLLEVNKRLSETIFNEPSPKRARISEDNNINKQSGECGEVFDNSIPATARNEASTSAASSTSIITILSDISLINEINNYPKPSTSARNEPSTSAAARNESSTSAVARNEPSTSTRKEQSKSTINIQKGIRIKYNRVSSKSIPDEDNDFRGRIVEFRVENTIDTLNFREFFLKLVTPALQKELDKMDSMDKKRYRQYYISGIVNLQFLKNPHIVEDMVKNINYVYETRSFEGSGWSLGAIKHFTGTIQLFQPYKGGSPTFIPSQCLGFKTKSIINVQNFNDEYCFKWSILAHILHFCDYRENSKPAQRKNISNANLTQTYMLEKTKIGLNSNDDKVKPDPARPFRSKSIGFADPLGMPTFAELNFKFQEYQNERE
uniref:Uncharacterized protein n=1 Tax=Megaselia scalaris TaxID=36166 RepID=T1GHC9_MEGSC